MKSFLIASALIVAAVPALAADYYDQDTGKPYVTVSAPASSGSAQQTQSGFDTFDADTDGQYQG